MHFIQLRLIAKSLFFRQFNFGSTKIYSKASPSQRLTHFVLQLSECHKKNTKEIQIQ